VQYGLFKVSAFLVDLIHPVQWYHCAVMAIIFVCPT
jgi:hypothetical protein